MTRIKKMICYLMPVMLIVLTACGQGNKEQDMATNEQSEIIEEESSVESASAGTSLTEIKESDEFGIEAAGEPESKAAEESEPQDAEEPESEEITDSDSSEILKFVDVFGEEY